MADSDVAAQFRNDQRRRSEQSILRGWRDAGHAPYGHLTNISGEGHGGVLDGFYATECAAASPVLATFLAKLDMVETGRALRGFARGT